MTLSKRFSDAFEYTFHLHAGQKRKGTTIPYISHLMGVASLVLEHGGGEDEAIAALLHDAVEDQGGEDTLEAIHTLFGSRVASVVQGCTDALESPKPPWKPRKKKYIKHLRQTKNESIRLVSAADKLHNARAILADYRQLKEKLWKRFNVGKDDQLWYYGELVEVFTAKGPRALAVELDGVVSELKNLARRRGSS